MGQPALHLEKVRALATTARLVFTGGVRADGSSQIHAYDLIAEKPEVTIDVPAHVLALHATDELLVAGCTDGRVRIYSHKGAGVREIAAHVGACSALAVHGDVLLTAGADGAMRSFSLAKGTKRKEWKLSSRALRAVAIDPTGESYAAGGDDGVIRVIRDGEAQRDMPGHDGPITCLAFTPSDGRLVSGGDDGTVRIWYLVGAIESDLRTKDDTVHTGGTTALLFTPAKDPDDIGDRVVSSGADGKLRIWRMSTRQKPRTLEAGSAAIRALAFFPSTRPGTLGSLVGAGDSRTIHLFRFDDKGAPTDTAPKIEHGFDVLRAALGVPAKASREATVKTLAALGETEALDLLLGAIATDRDPDVRALIATELAAHDRRLARKAIRARLGDDSAVTRAASLAALRKLEPDAPLSPLRAALDAPHADIRIAALELLRPLVATSPLASGLIAGRLADDHADVRNAALRELVALYPAASPLPLRTAFERGRADVRAQVLVRGALAGLAATPDFSPIVGKALDDEDADVRRVAFVVMLLTRPLLVPWLETRDEAFGRALGDVVRRAADVLGKKTDAPGLDREIAVVKNVSQFFVQLAHPSRGDVAIFKPNLHTPIEAGDKVQLIGLKMVGEQLRADDYVKAGAVVEEPKGDALAEIRGLLLKPASGAPTEADREPLLAALACRTSDTSLRGARGLALLGDMRALGALLTISRESDAALRRDAAFALVALEDPRAQRRLVWMTNDAEASVRDAALTCYARLERDPLAVAEAALHSSYEDIRVRGLDLLVKEGKGKPIAETLLGDAIEDEAAKVRSEAFRTLWAWHDREPLGPLDRALVARFPDLRLRAVTELASLAAKAGEPLGAPALQRLAATIADRDAGVAKAAYDKTLEIKGKEDVDTHLAAIASTHPTLRVQGAKDSARDPIDRVRGALMKLLEDTESSVRVAAIESLDLLLPSEPGAIAVGLQSSHLDLRVRAAELLSFRRDETLLDPMRALLADKELLLRMPAPVIVPLRQRAAIALANVGTPRLLKYFATELVKDDDPAVREQASRGLSNASRRGEEGHLLDLLGHAELPVRSWAAEGLARLGDARALPVLIGTLRHEHPPIRIGAILSFAALGPEGYGGLLQGLEDPSRDVQRIVLAVILARDLRAFRRGETPDLLTSALSSQRPEVRFAAARALELRIVAEHYIAYLVDVLMPDKPEKVEDMKDWPSEEIRARLMVSLAEALAGDRPEQRYAASQVLRLRDRPLVYFREVQRAVMPRSVKAPWAPDTMPRGAASEPPPAKGPLGMIRRLFAGGGEAAVDDKPPPPPSPVPPDEQRRLRQLAFGAFIGLLRQASADDEAHRVRRDAIDRIVELTTEKHVAVVSATPALARALDDPHHLVRQAAFAALRKVHGSDIETPLSLALASSSADVVKAALDEIATRGEAGKPRIVKALDSRVAAARKYAFDLLEKLSPPGSLEPLLAALGSEHADIRIGVLERLATSQDPRVAIALGKALESEHDDLRLRAAEMLAARRDDRAADALAPWLRAEDVPTAQRARDALARLGSAAAVHALAARFEEDVPEPERAPLIAAIEKCRTAPKAAIDALAALFGDGPYKDDINVATNAFTGCLAIVGPRDDAPRERGAPPAKPRDPELTRTFLEAATHSHHPALRSGAARELDDLADPIADSLLVSLFGDRVPFVRTSAVTAYAKRVEKKSAPPGPLEDVLKGGARETMLPAAEGLAHEHNAAALRPLLLFARAGEAGERERALLGLGFLGEKRALGELEVVAAGGTEEAPAEISMQAAALEALGWLLPKLAGDDRDRILDRVESSVGTKVPELAQAAVRALRGVGDDRSRARIELVLGEKSSSDPERVLAAKALGELANAASENALASALSDDTDDVRWAARESLERIFTTDRTRIEFLAVESPHGDIAEPAAAYLANEGDAGRLLAKLAKLSSAELRQRIRFGLVRRDRVPASDLEKLLDDASPAARADVAWVIGGRSASIGDAEKKTIAQKLLAAARTAEKAFAEATRLGKPTEIAAEGEAWLRATWALREIDPAPLRPDAKRWLLASDAPLEVRIESAFALRGGAEGDTSALAKALSDLSHEVRSAAASALAPTADVLAIKTTPLDPARLAVAATGAPLRDASLASSPGRQALLPRAIRAGETKALRALAEKSGDAQLDAIAALGRAATSDAITTLTTLASKDGSRDEAVRKAAFRSLRRAQRLVEKKNKEATS